MRKPTYDAFRLFTGLPPSEQIALIVSDCDRANGILSITKARAGGIERDLTKNGEDRRVELCPRAIAILESHIAWRFPRPQRAHRARCRLFHATRRGTRR